MKKYMTAAALAAVGTMTAATFLAACVPAASTNSVPTPTPPPPATFTQCQVVWAAQDPLAPNLLDALVVDGPQGGWINGPGLMATNNTLGFQVFFVPDITPGALQINVPGGAAAMFPAPTGAAQTNATAVTISGMNLNGTSIGAPLSVSISGTASELQLAGMDTSGNFAGNTVGTAENMNFTGVFSSFTALPATLGVGSATANMTPFETFPIAAPGAGWLGSPAYAFAPVDTANGGTFAGSGIYSLGSAGQGVYAGCYQVVAQ